MPTLASSCIAFIKVRERERFVGRSNHGGENEGPCGCCSAGLPLLSGGGMRLGLESSTTCTGAESEGSGATVRDTRTSSTLLPLSQTRLL